MNETKDASGTLPNDSLSSIWDRTKCSQTVDGNSPRIFKLNVDCLEEICHYLTIRDLLTLGQTCRLMQQVTGEYFKENYTEASKFGGCYGIYRVFCSDGTERPETSGFNKFVRYISHRSNDLAPLRYIESNAPKFISAKHLFLNGIHLISGRLRCLQTILNQMEIIQIIQCSMQFDFYESFLKYCGNLKRLYIQNDLGDIIKRNENDWLQKTYAKLEHLEFDGMKVRTFDVSELERFFQLNPNVNSFTTNVTFLMENQDKFLASNIRLDTFGVKIHRQSFRFRMVDLQLNTMTMTFQLLNQLYERGFFKQLHLHVTYIDAEYTNAMMSLYGLEKLCINRIIRNSTFNLHRVNTLKELAIFDILPTFDVDVLAQELTRLESLYICRATYGDILAFTRYATKLNRIILKDTLNLDAKRIKVVTLNEERKKLKNARKLTIYLPDDVFIASKWATVNGETDLKFVKIQRSDSYRWDHYYQ
ncbi:uncharacterized protein LOC116349803 [Contarinia nasturtii]|uniref:uncharacterized protein LOC116349803 n=1 Tax=Contarinia nasturtii TaxID=265458 RepID=UPI0012D4BE90|nr:uncharacterized protein LOC116349803 [Contarinia nasturtii]